MLDICLYFDGVLIFSIVAGIIAIVLILSYYLRQRVFLWVIPLLIILSILASLCLVPLSIFFILVQSIIALGIILFLFDGLYLKHHKRKKKQDITKKAIEELKQGRFSESADNKDNNNATVSDTAEKPKAPSIDQKIQAQVRPVQLQKADTVQKPMIIKHDFKATGSQPIVPTTAKTQVIQPKKEVIMPKEKVLNKDKVETNINKLVDAVDKDDMGAVIKALEESETEK